MTEVLVTVPPGFTRDGELAPIDLTQTPQLALEQWGSARDPAGATTIAWACVGTDVGTWNADVTELANQKLAEIASGTAARMHGSATPMHVARQSVDTRDRTLAADEGDAAARTFLVFTEAPRNKMAHGCFVACARDCGRTIDEAKVTGELREAPAAGAGLRALSYAVHHPRVAAGALLATRHPRGRPRDREAPWKIKEDEAFPRLSQRVTRLGHAPARRASSSHLRASSDRGSPRRARAKRRRGRADTVEHDATFARP